MGSAKTKSPRQPRPFGYERMEMLAIHDVVEALAVAHLSRAVFWRLAALGTDAVPSVRDGLTNPNPRVRRGCCEFLDLYWDDETAEAVVPLLADPDPDVQWMAAHALSCERCKNETWAKRPPLDQRV